MTDLQIILLSLVATVLIEYGVLRLLGESRRRILRSSVVINLLTNVPLNIWILSGDVSFAEVLLAELLIILAEGLWYLLFLRNLRQAFVYSSLCNAISFLTGLLAELLYMYFQLY